MPKRKLADRILDEIVTLRRPRSLLLEMDEHKDVNAKLDRFKQDVVREESAPFDAARRQLIVE
jgi:hypothetical protein